MKKIAGGNKQKKEEAGQSWTRMDQRGEEGGRRLWWWLERGTKRERCNVQGEMDIKYREQVGAMRCKGIQEKKRNRKVKKDCLRMTRKKERMKRKKGKE